MINLDRIDEAISFVSELLGQRSSRGGVLDQDFVGFEAPGELKRGVAEDGILESIADEIEQVVGLVHDEPRRTYRPVILRAVLGRRIPALDDPATRPTWRRLVVIAQPGPL